MPAHTSISTDHYDVNGTRLNVATAGEDPAVLLMHGFPHTWRVWESVILELAARHRVIAPDLRGTGGSERAEDGYDARTLSEDMAALLDRLDVEQSAVVAIDAGVPPAFVLAMEHPERVTRLVLIEALVGLLPGAEDFLKGGPPWWFGFHSVPGLAESVLLGHESEYVDFFLTSGTADKQGVDPALRDAFVDAYSGADSLRSAFAYYRAAGTNAAQITELAATRRLTVPTMTIGANTVRGATFDQLAPIADDIVGHVIDTSGHIVPLDQPRALLDLLEPFLA